MTHSGAEPVTALAFVVIVEPRTVSLRKTDRRLYRLIAAEASSSVHSRLGYISKQGSTLRRFLMVEVAQAAARFDADWRNGSYI